MKIIKQQINIFQYNYYIKLAVLINNKDINMNINIFIQTIYFRVEIIIFAVRVPELNFFAVRVPVFNFFAVRYDVFCGQEPQLRLLFYCVSIRDWVYNPNFKKKAPIRDTGRGSFESSVFLDR